MYVVNKWNFILFYLIAFLLSFCQEKPKTAETQDKVSQQKDSSEVKKMKTILFFGNSITAGYGLDPSESFPSLIQNKIDSMGLPYKVINAGLSGETSAAGLNRVDWVLRQPVDIFILELGANDGLRGLNLAETRKNLQAIIDRVKSKYPEAKIVLAGMEIPPSMGSQYTSGFRKIFPELASKNNIYLIPFLLKDVGGEVKFNQADGIHPNAEGSRIVANNAWEVLKTIIS